MNQVKSKNSPQARSRYRSLIQYVIWTLISSVSLFIFGLLIYNQQTWINLTGQEYQQAPSFSSNSETPVDQLKHTIPREEWTNHESDIKKVIIPRVQEKQQNELFNTSLETWLNQLNSAITGNKCINPNTNPQNNKLSTFQENQQKIIKPSLFLEIKRDNIIESIRTIVFTLEYTMETNGKLSVEDLEKLNLFKETHGGITVKNLKDLKFFELQIGNEKYLLRLLNNINGKAPVKNYLRATKFDPSNIAKTFKVVGNTPEKHNEPVFLKTINKPSENVWILSEHLDISLSNDYVKNGGIEAIKKIARDMFQTLQYLHEKKHMAYNGFFKDVYIAGNPVLKDGKVMFNFKLTDLGYLKAESDYKNPEDFNAAKKQDIAYLCILLEELYANSNSIENVIGKDDKELFLEFYNLCKLPESDVGDYLKHPFLKEGS